MKYLLFIVIGFLSAAPRALCGGPVVIPAAPAASPLAVFDKSWNNAVYAACNTAAEAPFMSDKEKELIYILNLARRYPAQFANTVVKQYPAYAHNERMAGTDHYQSLLRTMRQLPQSTLLQPDGACYASAQCHAATAGAKGYVGHNRVKADCKRQQHFQGECCDYGHAAPIDIVMSLLVDEGVSNLGHRLICFTTYTKIGVSIEPHREYGSNAVLDFYY
jgi:hypothetical protein